MLAVGFLWYILLYSRTFKFAESFYHELLLDFVKCSFCNYFEMMICFSLKRWITLVDFLTALLRHNWHKIKFTYLKCVIWCYSICIYACKIMSVIKILHLSITSKNFLMYHCNSSYLPSYLYSLLISTHLFIYLPIPYVISHFLEFYTDGSIRYALYFVWHLSLSLFILQFFNV